MTSNVWESGGSTKVESACEERDSPNNINTSSNMSSLNDDSIGMQWSDDCCEPDSSTSLPESKVVKKEQKRRPKPKDGTKLICRVCNDVALGYNFDAVTCESCKAFFRRNALKKKAFNCTFDGNCRLDPHTRKFCSSCRLKKCFLVGMKKDWILNEEQLAKRRQRLSVMTRKPSMDNVSPSSSASSPGSCIKLVQTCSSNSSEPPPVPSLKTRTLPADAYPVCNDMYWNTIGSTESTAKTLTLIRQLVQEHEKTFNENYPCDIMSIPRTAKEFFALSSAFMCRLTNFMKYIPDFQKLPKEDRIAIFRGSIREVSMIRASMAYSCVDDLWIFKNKEGKSSYLDAKILQETLGEFLYLKIKAFIQAFKLSTNDDKVIMILLLLIEFFDQDKSILMSKEVVVEAQEKYLMWLRVYIYAKYPVEYAKVLYPRVLVKLMDVREVGDICNEASKNFLLHGIDPLTAEVLDLKLNMDTPFKKN